MPKLDNEPTVSIEEVFDFGMVSVKADFLDAKTRALLESVTGITSPNIGRISIGKKISVAWMSVDEYAIFLKNSEANKMSDKISSQMHNHHHLCVNMSDSRRCYRLLGNGWREVLSKGTPANLHPKVFGKGSFRRTRIANIAVGIWVHDNNEAYLFSMYSVGNFIFDWLNNANLRDGMFSYY